VTCLLQKDLLTNRQVIKGRNNVEIMLVDDGGEFHNP